MSCLSSQPFIVENDAQAIGAAIYYLMKHPEEAARMGRDARRLVAENWSVEASVDRLENNLRKVVDAALQRRQRERADLTITTSV